MSAPQAPYSVGDLTYYLKSLMETTPALANVRVAGEVSNLTYHSSGHTYFSLKDARAVLSCAIFRGGAPGAPRLQAGDKIVAQGSISLYPPQGRYQLVVNEVQKEAGRGDLFQKFLETKEALAREGLFDPGRKRPIPVFPRRVAVITSPTGAALRDVLRTLRRRYPVVQVVLVPAQVQGEAGAASIVRSLRDVAGLRADTVILARGGGSLEDLWCFNEAIVARAVAACPLPVITGIGHETDVTLADFAADERASTPTAAAERAVPELAAVRNTLAHFGAQAERILRHHISFSRQLLDDYENRLLTVARHGLAAQRQALGDYDRRLATAMRHTLTTQRQALALLHAQLEAHDRSRILAQGYTLTLQDGRIVASAQALAGGTEAEIVFADGRRRVDVP